MHAQSFVRRTASRALVVAGVVSVPVGLVTWAYPPAVDDTVWGYPFPPRVLIVVSIVLIVAHLLKAHGFVGLSTLPGGGPVTRSSMLVAALGFCVVAFCEGMSAWLGGTPTSAPAVENLDNGYGVGSMVLALGSIVGGVVIARNELLDGRGRWSVLLSGVFMLVVVTPALIAGRGPLAYLALTVWSMFYIWIGLALGRTQRRRGDADTPRP